MYRGTFIVCRGLHHLSVFKDAIKKLIITSIFMQTNGNLRKIHGVPTKGRPSENALIRLSDP